MPDSMSGALLADVARDLKLKRVNGTLRQQVASTKMWVNKYHQYKDALAVRNAAHACGLLFGKYQIAVLVFGEEDIESEIRQVVQEYTEFWNNELM